MSGEVTVNREALKSIHRELIGAVNSLDVSSALTRQYLHAAYDEMTALALATALTPPAPASASDALGGFGRAVDIAAMHADWEKLGQAVHRSWRDGMLRQGRTVEKERMAWETLPERDRMLDRYIGGEVVAVLLGTAPPAPASDSAEVGERPALWAEHQSLRLGGGYHNPQQCRLMEKLVDLDTALDIQAQAAHGVALARERLRWQREVLLSEATP